MVRNEIGKFGTISWWKDSVTKVFFLLVIFQFFNQLYAIYDALIGIDHPLLPITLSNYVAFPLYFLALLWGAATVLFYKFTKDIVIQKKYFWIIPLSLIAFYIFSVLLYYILIVFNPFG
tara:strand:+ start:25858 stop:26214 length:357 start_codon:yes stop_codon:yes gene_type:complete